MDIQEVLYGYIESQRLDCGYSVEKSYNYGTVESQGVAIGGIVGGAFNPDGQTISIKFCYNMGTIKSNHISNGGILGGTYYLYDKNDTSGSKNIVYGCYSLGKNQSSSPNQISSSYATVTECYYLIYETNISGYGFNKLEKNFKNTNSRSVWYALNTLSEGDWVVTEKNNGYVSLAWQNE